MLIGSLRDHLVEEKRSPRVDAFGHDLEAGQVSDHDQVAFESLGELVGKLTERALNDFFEATMRG